MYHCNQAHTKMETASEDNNKRRLFFPVVVTLMSALLLTACAPSGTQQIVGNKTSMSTSPMKWYEYSNTSHQGSFSVNCVNDDSPSMAC